jgi:hypothetical protein
MYEGIDMYVFKLGVSDLFQYLQSKLIECKYKFIRGKGFLYAKGTSEIMLVAHLDTVYKQPNKIFLHHGMMYSTTGLGADDRAGVACILNMLDRGFRPSVLFTDGEESGGTGAREFADNIKLDGIHLFVEIDRAGTKHFAYYTYELDEELEKYMLDVTGLEGKKGSFTDIDVLTTEYGIQGCNIATGYYMNHTKKEYLLIKQYKEACNSVENILVNPPEEVLKYDAEEDCAIACDWSWWRKQEFPDWEPESTEGYKKKDWWK